ncbi:hypothetical protein BJV77DRAFT_1047981 [Russula vinacea]|nr:hypothetical protein BJV77DRAFT_1047981 [Russula vinacea]
MFRPFLRALQALAPLAASPPCFPDPDCRFFKVTQRAETCTAACGPYQFPSFSWRKTTHSTYSERYTRPRT